MAMLIQLRYRIKAIETIKKITHAMRLISMSSRSRLKNKEDAIKDFMQTSSDLLHEISHAVPEWTHPLVKSSFSLDTSPLIILIGSTRGLCGNFNANLFHFFERSSAASSPQIPIIAIGKKAVAYVEANVRYTLIAAYPDITPTTIPVITQNIMERFLQKDTLYSNVIVFSNKLKTFFIQKPQQVNLVPLEPLLMPVSPKKETEYYWEQPPAQILDQMVYQTVEIQLYYLIFQSLLAEHAARFISMDNATRNAQQLLEETQLQYNKLRQAKITKELSEFVSSLE